MPLRPRSRKLLRWICGGIVIPLAGYLLVSFQYYTAPPSIRVNYCELLNEPARAIPEDQRAWPRYRAALAGMSALELSELRVDSLTVAERADWKRRIESSQAALDDLRKASRMEKLGAIHAGYVLPEDRVLFPHEQASNADDDDNPLFMSILLVAEQKLHESSKLLQLDAQLARESGDGDRFMADVIAMLNISDHVQEAPFQVNYIIAGRIARNATAVVFEALTLRPQMISDEQLLELQSRLARYSGGWQNVSLQDQRWTFDDIAQRLFSDDGDGDGYLHLGAMAEFNGTKLSLGQQLLAPFGSRQFPSRTAMVGKWNELLDQCETAFAQPLWSYPGHAIRKEIAVLKEDPAWRLVWLLFPAVDAAYFGFELAKQERDAAITAVALERYRRERGNWPPDLRRLVPDYLAEVPRDRFDGTPIKFRLAEDGPQLYSVGPDLDDDGGRDPGAPVALKGLAELWQDGAGRRLSPVDGDWRLWPLLVPANERTN